MKTKDWPLIISVIATFAIGFAVCAALTPVRKGVIPPAKLDTVVKAHHYVRYEEVYFDGHLHSNRLSISDGDKSESYENDAVETRLSTK